MLDLWTTALEAYRRHGALFVLTCHPFLSGRPTRIETLRRLVEHALSLGDVEFRSLREVAETVAGPRRRLDPVDT